MNIMIGLIQMSCAADRNANMERAIERIREAAALGAQIICLPELFMSLYFCQAEEHQNFALAEEIPGPATYRLGNLAGELEIVLIAPIFEHRAPGIYHNSALVFDADGSIAGKYRKMHIPDDPLYHEKFYFAPGDLGFPSWETRYGRIGVLICWDQWYPEAARLAALNGAKILFYPTAIGWHPSEKAGLGEQQHSAWETIQRGHSIANGIYVAAVNRIGHEGDKTGGIEFWGASFVSDPFGNVISRASHDREEVLTVACDLQQIDIIRTQWPFLRDRRLEAYQDLTKRYID